MALPSGDALFVKGVPRGRAEASVSARLAELCPEAVAPVLAVDLIPGDAWCWFVLGDAGRDGGARIPHVGTEANRIFRVGQSAHPVARSGGLV